jgi:hypothetical protein
MQKRTQDEKLKNLKGNPLEKMKAFKKHAKPHQKF